MAFYSPGTRIGGHHHVATGGLVRLTGGCVD